MSREKMKRVILIGRSMAGKTTLCQYISRQDLRYNKTQTVEVVNGTMIDTPGEYLERTNLRGALTVSAVDADVILLVQPANEAGTMFPPGYSSTFAKPCIGVVTKADLDNPLADLAEEKQIEDAKKYLQNAGAREIVVTSSFAGTGFEELMEFLRES